MKRVDAIKNMLNNLGTLNAALFQNMQERGSSCLHPLDDISPTLTSAMGLGGGQTPVLVVEI